MLLLWFSTAITTDINTTATTGTTPEADQAEQELSHIEWFSPKHLYIHLLSITTEALEHIVYACMVYIIVCLCIYKLTFAATNGIQQGRGYLWRWMSNIQLPKPEKLQRVMFVISHPDDECMFFGPLIYTLAGLKDCQVYVLCLSNGNYEKKSQLRREELWRSCSKLGIPPSNILLVNATELPDDPNAEWKPNVVANLILYNVESLDIQAIFTFDRDGVSQHPNHCALYYAATALIFVDLLPKTCKLYALDSINFLRKYLSIFDLLWTWFMSTHWCILSWRQASIIRDAMKEHESQMKWFRWLYIYCSRYMFINSFREINRSDVELEMQLDDN